MVDRSDALAEDRRERCQDEPEPRRQKLKKEWTEDPTEYVW